MKVLGITAEYNPFHNGHKYHIEKSREITGADCVVVVMSGNFTQRGEPAILDKWERSRLAVENGADLVVELPFVYACSRAEIFAKGAVDILSGLGVDIVCFGSENGDISVLKALAKDLSEKKEEIDIKRTEIMQNGASFAKASELAAAEMLGRDSAELMLEPNNILALEYLKRIFFWNERGHVIEPVTVKRYGSGYFTENEDTGFAGASAIRRMKTVEEFGKYVPDSVAEALNDSSECNVHGKKLRYETVAERALYAETQMFSFIRYELLRSTSQELSHVYHMGEGLENKLKKEIVGAKDMKDLLSKVVSRRYTEAAIRRLLVYVLLGIRGYDLPQAVYGRVLAADDTGRKLLAALKKQDGHMPLITNVNKDWRNNKTVRECIYYDVLASDMYNLLHGRDIYAFSDKVRKPYMAGIVTGAHTV